MTSRNHLDEISVSNLRLRDVEGTTQPQDSGSSTSSSNLPGSYLDPEGELQRILGPGHEAVKVEKQERCFETETLMVNGRKVLLEGEDGDRIRDCLTKGILPDQDLINTILAKAGLVLRPNSLRSPSQQQLVTTTELTVTRSDTQTKNIHARSTSQGSPEKQYSSTQQQVTSYSASRRTTSPTGPQNGISSPKLIVQRKLEKPFLEVFFDNLSETDADVKEEEEADFALLLWFRHHLNPLNLLSEMSRRQQDALFSGSRMARFIRRWVKWFPKDFKADVAFQELKNLCLSKFLSQQVSPHLLSTLSSHLAVISRHKGFLQDVRASQIEVTDELLSCFIVQNPLNVARELTRIELDYLAFLGPEEILNSVAKDGKKDLSGDAKERLNTDNLDEYTGWFNHLSYLVATTVCRTKRKKLRVRCVRHWIEVARQCVNIGNFNSLMGVITGLNMAPVSRLTKTWEAVHSEKFSVLEHQMDPSSNFSSYRSTLTAAIARSEAATDDRARSVVPFLSLFKKDLLLAREKYLQTLEERINFNLESSLPVSNALREFTDRKELSCCCSYPADANAAKILKVTVLKSDDDLDLASYASEPPRNSMEKRRYKELKKSSSEK